MYRVSVSQMVTDVYVGVKPGSREIFNNMFNHCAKPDYWLYYLLLN